MIFQLRSLLAILLLALLCNCNNADDTKQKELELKEKELALKEKELEQKEQTSAVVLTPPEASVSKTATKGTNPLSDIENLIGNWFVPHAATTNIKFMRDGRFEFNDYNENLAKDELLTGTFKLENGNLSLLYDDRPKQNFKFYQGDKGDDNFYIRKGSYYFVKGENGQ